MKFEFEGGEKSVKKKAGHRYIPRAIKRRIISKLALVRAPYMRGSRFKDPVRNKSILHCEKNIRKAIEKNAQIHSYRLEYPNETVPYSIPRNSDIPEIYEGVENIMKAFKWGEAIFDVEEEINAQFIKGIAGRIDPKLYPEAFADYRPITMGLRIENSRVTPPYPEKVRNIEMPEYIRKLNLRLKQKGPENRITSAIYSHLHLARIHPFEDGNGRTARVLQDIILNHYEIPCPIIKSGERDTYNNLIEGAIFDYKHIKQSGDQTNGATQGERLFYTFMAEKIEKSVDKLLDCVGNNLEKKI